MSEAPGFAITLFVPDATLRALNSRGGVPAMVGGGDPELGFLPPPWWEVSHTVSLGLISPGEDSGAGPAVEPDL